MSIDEGLSNIDIALYALYKLGGGSRKTHTEHIAWESYRLSEERFSWSLPEFRKRGFPDKTIVRHALEDAKKLKLVNGRAGRNKSGGQSEGWQFSPSGLEWFIKNEERISNSLGQEKPISRDLPKHQAERFIKKIYSDKIFKLFQEKGSLDKASVYDLTDMLNCSPDASKEIFKQKFTILKNTAIAINRPEIRSFLDKCENRFRDLLITEGGSK